MLRQLMARRTVGVMVVDAAVVGQVVELEEGFERSFDFLVTFPRQFPSHLSVAAIPGSLSIVACSLPGWCHQPLLLL